MSEKYEFIDAECATLPNTMDLSSFGSADRVTWHFVPV